MFNSKQILSSFDPANGTISGLVKVERHLSDLRGCFVDLAAYERTLALGNPVLYSVAAAELGSGPGDLNYAVGLIMPGRVGDEYFMTKGHLHAWREAAEIYIGLSGQGVMLLEDEATGESQMAPLRSNQVVYVPGKTAHRTMNTGQAPLSYLGIYPAKAGHDYDAIASRNFRCVVIEHDGRPIMVERKGVL
ncbi:MAG TPA: glucose-6-phosphate isomerase family protein [Verrucomicrobiae bacterium]|nr:glucose-6-phosphate isomerase family protein [Verrucomicrobiae bacterium]